MSPRKISAQPDSELNPPARCRLQTAEDDLSVKLVVVLSQQEGRVLLFHDNLGKPVPER